MKHKEKSSIELTTISSMVKNIALNSASLIRTMPSFVPLAYLAVFIFTLILSATLNAFGKVNDFKLLLFSTFTVITLGIIYSFAYEFWCKYKGISIQDSSTSARVDNIQLNVEMQGLFDATRAAAEALRAKAAEIDDVAQLMAESRDPAAAGQVIELIHSAVADTKIDLFLKQVIKANKIEPH